MNRDELLQILLIERFAPKAERSSAPHSFAVAEIRAVHNDDDLLTHQRRKALDDACVGFDIPRFGNYRESTPVDQVAAGQSLPTSAHPHPSSTEPLHYPQT